MRSILLSILLTTVYFLSGCHTHDHNTKDSTFFDKFSKKDSIVFTEYGKLDSISSNRIYVSDSNLIVLNMAKSHQEDYFNFYSENSGKKIAGYIPFGRKPGQALNAFSSGVYGDSMLWLRDISIGKILVAKYNNRLLSVEPQAIREYPIPGEYYSVSPLDTTLFAVSGSRTSKSIVQLLDVSSGKVVKESGMYDDPPSGFDYFNWKNAHEGFLFSKPAGRKSVLACRYADEICVFDFDADSYRFIKGPERYEPDVKPVKQGEYSVATRTEKTRFAFVGGTVSDQYIFLLYSGNNSRSYHKVQGKQIYVYDWNGNPIHQFTLDRYVNGIAIAKDNTTIYAIDNSSIHLLKAKIKI